VLVSECSFFLICCGSKLSAQPVRFIFHLQACVPLPAGWDASLKVSLFAYMPSYYLFLNYTLAFSAFWFLLSHGPLFLSIYTFSSFCKLLFLFECVWFLSLPWKGGGIFQTLSFSSSNFSFWLGIWLQAFDKFPPRNTTTYKPKKTLLTEHASGEEEGTGHNFCPFHRRALSRLQERVCK